MDEDSELLSVAEMGEMLAKALREAGFEVVTSGDVAAEFERES